MMTPTAVVGYTRVFRLAGKLREPLGHFCDLGGECYAAGGTDATSGVLVQSSRVATRVFWPGDLGKTSATPYPHRWRLKGSKWVLSSVGNETK